MVPRFPEISFEEIEKPAEKAINKNAVKTAKTWMNVWKSWAESKGLKDDIVKYEAQELDKCLVILCRNSQKQWLRLWAEQPKSYVTCPLQTPQTKWQQHIHSKGLRIRQVQTGPGRKSNSSLVRLLSVKPFLIPKLLYVSSIIETPYDISRWMEKMIYKFLCKGPDKVTRNSVINTLEYGGLNLTDIETQIKALRLSWILSHFRWKERNMEIVL